MEYNKPNQESASIIVGQSAVTTQKHPLPSYPYKVHEGRSPPPPASSTSSSSLSPTSSCHSPPHPQHSNAHSYETPVTAKVAAPTQHDILQLQPAAKYADHPGPQHSRQPPPTSNNTTIHESMEEPSPAANPSHPPIWHHPHMYPSLHQSPYRIAPPSGGHALASHSHIHHHPTWVYTGAASPGHLPLMTAVQTSRMPNAHPGIPPYPYYPHMVPYHQFSHYPPTTVQSTTPSTRTETAQNVDEPNSLDPSNPRKDDMKVDELRESPCSPSRIHSQNQRDEAQNLGCTCKRTRCLKLYCQCFAARLYCGTQCQCLSCCNVPSCEKIRKEAVQLILARNPSAFETKFLKVAATTAKFSVQTSSSEIAVTTSNESSSTTQTSTTQTPDATVVTNPELSTPISKVRATAQIIAVSDVARVLAHKTGCRCKKSNCTKKYCECYAGFVRCTSACKCIGCKNMGPGGDNRPGRGLDPPVTIPSSKSAVHSKRYARNVRPDSAPSVPSPRTAYPYPSQHPENLYEMHQQVMSQHPMPNNGPNTRRTYVSNCVAHPPSSPSEIDQPTPHSITNSFTQLTPSKCELSGIFSCSEDLTEVNKGNCEPWLAAQNLTFMKRGSPISGKKFKTDHSAFIYPEITNIPSLAESSEGASEHDDIGTEQGMSSILLAAVAMTEFARSC